ncbi:MAG: hypothetical protein JWM11_2211 [Planctomycetaceae bacterium]|jgi:hypothetical protein|nr:hypothetical protein [Planctomycetaceae bacterium]
MKKARFSEEKIVGICIASASAGAAGLRESVGAVADTRERQMAMTLFENGYEN